MDDDIVKRLRIKREDRVKAAHAIYGHHSADYHIGAAMAALDEADAIAKALGVERLRLHSRLEQYAALAWQIKLKETKHD